jgi:hypothetical protein
MGESGKPPDKRLLRGRFYAVSLMFPACYGSGVQPGIDRLDAMSGTTPPPYPEAPKKSTPWPGHELGLPQSGPRSIGRLGRRILALAIDWAIAVIIAVAFFHYNSFATLGIFALMQMIFLITIGGSIGHLILRMRVTPVRGGYLGIWRPIVRTVLLCIVIPAVIYDQDQRGLHDRAVGTILVRV